MMVGQSRFDAGVYSRYSDGQFIASRSGWFFRTVFVEDCVANEIVGMRLKCYPRVLFWLAMVVLFFLVGEVVFFLMGSSFPNVVLSFVVAAVVGAIVFVVARKYFFARYFARMMG